MKWLSKLVDDASDFLARRKGLLPLLGILMVFINFILPLLMAPNFFTLSNFFLHLGHYHRHPRLDARKGAISMSLRESASERSNPQLKTKIASLRSQRHGRYPTQPSPLPTSTRSVHRHLPPTISATGISTHRDHPT